MNVNKIEWIGVKTNRLTDYQQVTIRTLPKKYKDYYDELLLSVSKNKNVNICEKTKEIFDEMIKVAEALLEGI